LPAADSRMRDMEFILRFFALSSHELLSSKNDGRISLKKYLNEFMGSSDVRQPDKLDSMRENFIQTASLVNDRFGKEAFHNISPKEPGKLIKKFNPTIFDSIMIASNLAARRGLVDTQDKDYRKLRLELLHNDEYQDLIKVRTTDIDRIQKRVLLALQYLYNIDYE
jgi:hypothetical protein